MSPPESTPSAAHYVPIGPELEGQRIDNFLMTRVKGVPRSHVYRVLRKGEVRVNKGRVKPSYRLRQGDRVRIPPLRMPEATPPGRPPSGVLKRLERSVLYEDDRLIALNKPVGLAVHGGSGLSFGLIEAMRALRPRSRELELVHRLDRDTSGCLLISKRRSSLRELHRLIRANALDKRYIALLTGRLPRRETVVNAALRKNVLRSGERVVCADPDGGKPARTVFRRLRGFGDLTLVEAKLVTGRTHQIRVHGVHVGAPVAGDDKYGDPAATRRLRHFGLKRMFLHASALSFHPDHLNQPLHIEAPLPSELKAVIEALEKEFR